jgi:hypothetical protein
VGWERPGLLLGVRIGVVLVGRFRTPAVV